MKMAAALACLVVGSCCPARTAPPPLPAPAQPAATNESALASPTAGPKLVVVVVIDQLAGWALEKYLPFLPEDGAIRSGMARGQYFSKVAYSYALTNTAPGHSATHTGAPPSVSGVTSNTMYDVETGKMRAFISDGKHAVFGNEGRTASPAAQRVPTIGDELHRVTGGAAQVVSISGKDRAAILSGGQHADLVIWYDHRARAMTTSTYYANAVPAWLTEHQQTKPLADLLVPWTPGDPGLLARAAGPDDGKGEGDYANLGITFPHDPNKAGEEKWSVLRLLPQLSEYVIDVAAVASAQRELGEDDVPDLLALSVSGLDYAGHTFGPDSWEYLDHLIRIDKALASFFAKLQQERGPIAVLITSDHGIAPLPPQNPGASGRIGPAEIEKLAKDAVAEVTGKPEQMNMFMRPFIFLDPVLRDGPDRAKAIAAIRKNLEAHPGIYLAVDVREAMTWRNDPDRIKRSVGLAVAEGTPGEMFVMLASGWVVDENRPPGAGTTHGTPWDHDRLVPVVVWGQYVDHGRHDGEIAQNRVAPTIARLLGIKPPAHISAEPLPGVRAVPQPPPN
jgi:hypothetical protein